MRPDPRELNTLIERSRNGDMAAAELLANEAIAIARRSVGDLMCNCQEVNEDCMQDSVIAVWSALIEDSKTDPSESSLRRVAREAYKKTRRKELVWSKRHVGIERLPDDYN